MIQPLLLAKLNLVKDIMKLHKVKTAYAFGSVCKVMNKTKTPIFND